jgi:hypothetical protein
MFGAAVRSAGKRLTAVADLEAEFGSDDKPVALARDCASDKLLIDERTVNLGKRKL